MFFRIDTICRSDGLKVLEICSYAAAIVLCHNVFHMLESCNSNKLVFIDYFLIPEF